MSKTCLMCGEMYPDAATFCPRDGSALRATVIGDDLIGELFCERYVVTDMLGEGGMATVYLARDVRLPQQVAIKVLRDTGTADPTVVQRFRQEAEAASRINHDRVARVSDFGFMTDGRAFLVMEFVNGRTLRQLLDDRGALSFAETATIIGMVAEGLNAAHRLGIVHRDLKPENVMVVEEEDGALRAKVLDFGIAKLLGSQEGEGRTAPGFVIGTPKWMSPEQLLGAPLDGRSDIYSLALMAFSMLTGDRAFIGTSEQAEMMARLSTAPRTLAEAKPDVAWPDELQTLFDRTLVRDPGARPETALAFARELRRIVEGPVATTTLATPPVPTPPVPTPPVPTPISASIVDANVAATPAADVVPAQRTPATSNNVPHATPNAARTEAPAPARATRAFPRVAAIGSVVAVGAIAAVMLWPRERGPSSPTDAAAVDTATTAPLATPVPPAPAAADTSTNVEPPVAAIDSLPPGPSRSPSPVPRAPSPAAGTAAVPRTPSPAAGTAAPSPSRSPSPVPGAPSPAAGTAASDALEKLISDAEESIGSDDDAAKRTKATELIRQLNALMPRLRTDADRGWATFYIGTSRATLGDNERACASLRQAQALATTSRALKSNSEKFLLELNCNR